MTPDAKARVMTRGRRNGHARAASNRVPRASRRDGAARRRQLQRVLEARHARSSCCCSTTATPQQPSRVIPLDPRRAPHLPLLARVRARTSGRGRSTPIARTGRSRPSAGLRFDGEKVLLDPYGLAVAVPDAYDRTAARRPGANAAIAMKSVVADPGRYDWEGDAPAQAAVRRDGDLRAARARLHPASQLGRRAGEARHLRRPDRKDSLSEGSRASPPSSCCRSFSSIRRTRRPAG